MAQLSIPTKADFVNLPIGEVIEPDFDDAEFELQDMARFWSGYEMREAA